MPEDCKDSVRLTVPLLPSNFQAGTHAIPTNAWPTDAVASDVAERVTLGRCLVLGRVRHHAVAVAEVRAVVDS